MHQTIRLLLAPAVLVMLVGPSFAQPLHKDVGRQNAAPVGNAHSSLNPQPIPPRWQITSGHPAAKVQLNPQPIPPGEFGQLNPQPIPPKAPFSR